MLNTFLKIRKISWIRKISASGNPFIKYAKKAVHRFMEREWRQQKKSFGDLNSDKTIYIIRRQGTVVGLFSYLFTALARIKEADENGWIPVVDMQNYPNAYLEEANLGKENVWEYFFLQPAGVPLKEAYQSKHVILSDGAIADFRPKASMEFLVEGNKELISWRTLAKKYFILNEYTNSYIDTQYKKLFTKSDKVLGIIIRGTDYTKLRPKGHPIQPSIDEIMEKLRGGVIKDFGINKVFLATEDYEIYKSIKNKIENEFHIPVLINEKKWVSYKNGYLAENHSEKIRKSDKYLSGLEYLTTIVILSRANCLIGGRPGGATAAMILSEGYEYTYFWIKDIIKMFVNKITIFLRSMKNGNRHSKYCNSNF